MSFAKTCMISGKGFDPSDPKFADSAYYDTGKWITGSDPRNFFDAVLFGRRVTNEFMQKYSGQTYGDGDSKTQKYTCQDYKDALKAIHTQKFFNNDAIKYLINHYADVEGQSLYDTGSFENVYGTAACSPTIAPASVQPPGNGAPSGDSAGTA
jgi:hypothetical protein